MTLAIKIGTLIDGCGGEPIRDAILLLEGERIAAVGPIDTITIPDGANVVEASARTAMPGLIDAHVHAAVTTMDALLFRRSSPSTSAIRR